MKNDEAVGEAEFFPKGALFFFAALAGFYALAWLGLYALMISRA